MKVTYKNTVYRTENLTTEQKQLMKVEIEKAEAKEKAKVIEPEKQEKHVKKGAE